MKSRRGLYIIVGIILIVINLLIDLLEFSKFNKGSNDSAYTIGYFIGSHVLLLFGLILLRIAYKLQQKIKKTDNNHLEESIDNIGNT